MVSVKFQISNFSTYSNLTVLLLWVVVVILSFYIKHLNTEVLSVSLRPTHKFLIINVHSRSGIFVLHDARNIYQEGVKKCRGKQSAF